MAEQGRYHFGPLEKRGVIAGWRGGQIAAVASALVVSVGVLRSRPDVGGLLASLVLVAGALAVAFWPVRGRTPEEWFPAVARWALRRGLSGRTRLSGVPASGRPSGPSGPAPGQLDGCCILSLPTSAGSLGAGVVFDRRSRTYSAVLAVRGQAFALLDAEEKGRRVSAWAAVLAGLAREGSLVHRLQWVERSFPDDGGALEASLQEAAALSRDTPQARSYADLVRSAGPVTQRHEVLLALSVHAGRSARAIRAAGRGHQGACEVLYRELRSVQVQLGAAHIALDGVLQARPLASVLRRAVDLAPSGGWSDGDAPDRAPAWPWPLARDAGWASYRTDATWHATYWIAEWPRVDVGADFMAPLVLQSGARRTVSVVMEPVSPTKAAREVEHARTSDAADTELRRSGGFLLSARRRREQEQVLRRETELADGHAQYRFSGYVTVTSSGEDDLEAACGRVEQAAGQSRLELRRMYGEQERAFTYTLPLGRGLA